MKAHKGENKIILADELSELVVGKFYNVKCAIMSYTEDDFWNLPKGQDYWVPIIGIAHVDKQFGFDDKHFHIDGRFVGRTHYNKLDIDENGHTNQVCSYKPTRSAAAIKEVVIKRLKCKRLTTGINPPSYHKKLFKEEKNSYFKWYDTMIGKSCAGKKCPHFGTTMIEREGVLVCPLHNLHGDLKKEIIIPYPKISNHQKRV